jgi:hypothetical protein
MKRLASILTVASLLCAAQAMAQETAAGAERKWYGGETILADAASASLIALGAGTEQNAIIYGGVASYFLSPAVVHGVHHHSTRAVLSPAMRVVFPLTGLLLGYTLANCPEKSNQYGDGDWCGFLPAMVGFGMGAVAASVVDASVAWDQTGAAQPPPPPPSAKHSAVTFTSAGLVPTANGPRLMIGGRF